MPFADQAQSYDPERKDPFLAEGTTFKINVVSYGGHVDEDTRKCIINKCFDYIDFKGKVRPELVGWPAGMMYCR